MLIGLLHVLAFYGLVRAFAPDMTASVEQSVISAFTVTVTAPPDEPEEAKAPEPEPDDGAAGDPGKQAIPKPVTVPSPKVVLKRDQPAPRASSTGTAVTSGATEEGAGTGAAGTGLGTGSGQGGSGQGSGGGTTPTKPVHVSGKIDNARDYPVPEGGRRARRGNEVIVKVMVGTDGRASDCSIYRASPDADADRITCQLVVDRLRFKPAIDRNGDPVAAPFYWMQRWF